MVYIRVNRFANNTFKEFAEAIDKWARSMR